MTTLWKLWRSPGDSEGKKAIFKTNLFFEISDKNAFRLM